jgi:glycine cleavage system H protein
MADLNIPAEGYKFTKSDEWVKLEGDEALIGITDYAQDLLSDLVFVELPEVGDTFDQGDTFGVVESVKAAADVNMPVGGEVVAVNSGLEDAPETINSDAFGEGWIIRIKPSDTSELDGLMDAEAYRAYCEERA